MTRRQAGPRGPYAKTATRRDEILRVAMDVFARQGFRGSSLREIADRVGMSQAGVLHHFGSKELVLIAVLEQREAINIERGRSANGIEILDSLRDQLDHNTTVPGLTQLFATLSAEATDPEHPAHEFFVARYARVRAEMVEELEKARQAGDIAADVDVVHAGQVLISVMDGLQVQWLLDERVDMVAGFEHFLEGFRLSLGARHSARPARSSQ